MYRIILPLCLLLSTSWLSACAASTSLQANPASAAQPTNPVAAAAEQAARPAPPMSGPSPALRVRDTPKLDASCATDADCAVKNVGSCCGVMPACVNKDSPVDPAAAQARCEQEGRMGVCGFREISACQCTAGRCEEAGASRARLRAPPLPAEPAR